MLFHLELISMKNHSEVDFEIVHFLGILTWVNLGEVKFNSNFLFLYPFIIKKKKKMKNLFLELVNIQIKSIL